MMCCVFSYFLSFFLVMTLSIYTNHLMYCIWNCKFTGMSMSPLFSYTNIYTRHCTCKSREFTVHAVFTPTLCALPAACLLLHPTCLCVTTCIQMCGCVQVSFRCKWCYCSWKHCLSLNEASVDPSGRHRYHRKNCTIKGENLNPPN